MHLSLLVVIICHHHTQDGKYLFTLAVLHQGIWRSFSLPSEMGEAEAVKVQAWLLQHLKGSVQLPAVPDTASDWEAPPIVQAAVDETVETDDPEQRVLALKAAFSMWVKSLKQTDSSTYPGVFWVRLFTVETHVYTPTTNRTKRLASGAQRSTGATPRPARLRR